MTTKTKKTGKSIFKSAAMLFAALFIFTITCSAQAPVNNNAVVNTGNTDENPSAIRSMTAFTATLAEGTVYLNWKMKGETANSVYAVERSSDGQTYEAISYKDGIGTPGSSMELLYCSKDEKPLADQSYYRIKQYRSDGILYSQAIGVKVENTQPLSMGTGNE
ncbi:MAG: hypothetical protein WCM76_13155 [Bacteroidota bacterium]